MVSGPPISLSFLSMRLYMCVCIWAHDWSSLFYRSIKPQWNDVDARARKCNYNSFI